MGGKVKNNIRKFFKKARLKTWQLILLTIPLIFISATLLRFDNIKMGKLRDAVLAADVAEDDALIASSLSELQKFTFSHIVVNVVDENGIQKLTFGTGTFYLEHQYLRAAAAAIAEAEATVVDDSNPNGNIYAAAAAVCKPQAIANSWTWNSQGYINCMLSEIDKYPSSGDLQGEVTAKIPSTELYRHNYASPIWAPTLSGFVILITAILIVVIFIRFLIWLILRIVLIFLKTK